MYQDKIDNEAKEAITCKLGKTFHSNVFVKSKLEPLNFTPDEVVCDVTHIARDILSNRNNEEVIQLSKAIDSMLLMGENLLQNLAVKLLDSSNSRTSINLTQGRALYLLCDYFDLTTIEVKKAQWYEMFATLTLMQVAEISYMRSQSYENDDLSQALKLSAEHCIKELAEETIDSIARAECMYDKKSKSSLVAKSGGNAKAKNIDPLKVKVIQIYLDHFSHLNKKRAGREIEKVLTQEKSTLLLLSYSEDKDLQFSKWIGAFLDGKYKLPLNI